MTTNSKKHILEEMLADFGLYTYPEIIKDELKDLLSNAKVNKENLEKYNHLLISVNYAWQKVLRYDVYFQEFYSNSEKIERFEELNHHIHAYLQDMDTLKNKIENLFGALKNDLKKVAINKDEILGFFQAGIDKNNEVFSGVLKHRVQHVHKNFQFIDGDLLKVENAHRVIGMLNNPAMESVINQDYKPVAIAKLEKDKEEAFEVARNRWINTAHNNNEQTSGFLASMLGAIHSSLYEFLEIKPTNEILGLVNK